jgi:hypothetical protein
LNLISESFDLWADPRMVYAVTIAAVILLATTIWLFRRSKRDGRAAGMICLVLSIGLHGALFWLVPNQMETNGGSSTVREDPVSEGVEAFSISTFDPSLQLEQASGVDGSPAVAPLPVAELEDLLADPAVKSLVDQDLTEESESAPETPPAALPEQLAPDSLAATDPDSPDQMLEDLANDLDSSLDELLQSQSELAEIASDPEPAGEGQSMPDTETNPMEQRTEPPPQVATKDSPASENIDQVPTTKDPATTTAAAAMLPGSEEADFANRVGAAKQLALFQTGGDLQTEAAVEAALRFLASAQRSDGAWDPGASGAGVERKPLGESRAGAGKKSATGLTGLALLAMMGSGNTHLRGGYADNVYRGLSYLIGQQKPDGSICGNATPYAASYCHSMAALSLCEAAVMTQDPSAIESSRRAINHTIRMQHPVTGGWRYKIGDQGDLSQLGWQAMVLDGGKRAGITIRRENVAGVARFLRSVRAGRGGLAVYRPGEAPSRTMTAEALATRLLIGEKVPAIEIAEAERYLLGRLPGTGQDNYYYWYYATLALHQLQDEAWDRWNAALKRRLLATQRPDGSWPSGTVWGGYGGTVYTTAMATLCLETYYRHAIRETNHRVATRP